MPTLTATHAGQRFTRRTAKPYTFVLIGRNITPIFEGQLSGTLWRAIDWFMSKADAEAFAARYRSFWRELEVVPCSQM